MFPWAKPNDQIQSNLIQSKLNPQKRKRKKRIVYPQHQSTNDNPFTKRNDPISLSYPKKTKKKEKK